MNTGHEQEGAEGVAPSTGTSHPFPISMRSHFHAFGASPLPLPFKPLRLTLQKLSSVVETVTRPAVSMRVVDVESVLLRIVM